MIHDLQQWKHSHYYIDDNREGEKNTRRVILLTIGMMVIEIISGFVFGSMSLLADGWHMGTHAGALGITVFAYYYAQKHAENPSYTFGTGKVGVLGGFASAVILAIAALLMAAESFQRLLYPNPIRFNEAIAVAFLGLAVNLISAFLLQEHHHHEENEEHYHDHNLRAAYLHVLADALTSLLAIVALFAGKIFGWIWMNPFMGIIGSTVIMKWSYGLLKDTGKILLDRSVNRQMIDAIYSAIESDADNKIADIHVWRISSNHIGAIISVVTLKPNHPEYYKKLLRDFHELVHITVEVNPDLS